MLTIKSSAGTKVLVCFVFYKTGNRWLERVEYGSVTLLSQVLSIRVMLEVLVETTA
jgi:hypothetical protein